MSAEPAKASPRWVRWWVGAVTLSAFGPYLAGGVRTEQAIVYVSAAAVLMFGAPVLLRRATRAPLTFFVMWAALLVVAGIGLLWPPHNKTDYAFGSAFAGIDNLALPAALLLVTWFWVSAAPALDLIRTAAKAIIAALSINAAITFVHLDNPPGWLRNYWSSGAGETVADRAAQLGRYTGIFNQPAEAGIAYSLAVFCLVYLARTSRRPRPLALLACGTLLTVGGVLSTSKVFLLGGLPIVVYVILRDKARRARIVTSALLGGALFFVADSFGLLPNWTGAAMIERLFTGRGSWLDTFTAGRFGDTGTISASTDELIAHHLWFGVGAQGLQVAYDTAWLEMLAVAGLFGCGVLALVFLTLLSRWWRLRATLPRPEWVLAGATVLLLLAASLAMPSLTGNRVATLAWILLGLLVTTRLPSQTHRVREDRQVEGVVVDDHTLPGYCGCGASDDGAPSPVSGRASSR